MIRFRPHHFLCALGFEGKGYSPGFVSNFSEIVGRLRAVGGDGESIRVEEGLDSVCSACPNQDRKRDRPGCQQETRIRALDESHARVHGLEPGRVLTWGEAKRRLVERFTDEAFDRACSKCSWKAMGACEAALKRLRSDLGAMMVAAVLIAPQAWSAKPAQARKQVKSNGASTPVKIEKDRDVTKAAQAFRKDQFAKLLEIAPKLAHKEKTGDLGLALEAHAQRALALGDIEKKRWDSLSKRAARLMRLSTDLRENHPLSAYLGDAGEWAAFSDWFRGVREAERKKWAESQKHFARGFSRIPVSKASGWLTSSVLKSFATACSKKPGEECVYWVRRLAPLYPKDSVETAAIRSIFDKTVLDSTINPPALGPRLTQRYPVPDEDQPAFDEALQLALKGEVKPSIKKFDEFIAKYPRSSSRVRALYWLGLSRILREDFEDAKKSLEEIVRHHPLSYYGLLSQLGLKIEPERALSKEIPRMTLEDPLAEPAEISKIRKAQLYLDSAAPELAYFELREFPTRRNHSNEFLLGVAQLASRAGASLTAFRIMSELVQRQAPGVSSTTAFEIYYPLAYWDQIQKFAQERDLDPILVLSLIKQESSFIARIGSGVGAAGLMQLMPYTATYVDPKVEQIQLLQPEANLRLGTKYLSDLVKRFDGNWAMALAGYNAGPHRVLRWLKEGSPKWGLFEFIEAIPYRETRDYVGSIMRNYYWYTYKIRGKKLDSLDLFWRKTSKFVTTAGEPQKEIPKELLTDSADGALGPTPVPDAAAVPSPVPGSDAGASPLDPTLQTENLPPKEGVKSPED